MLHNFKRQFIFIALLFLTCTLKPAKSEEVEERKVKNAVKSVIITSSAWTKGQTNIVYKLVRQNRSEELIFASLDHAWLKIVEIDRKAIEPVGYTQGVYVPCVDGSWLIFAWDGSLKSSGKFDSLVVSSAARSGANSVILQASKFDTNSSKFITSLFRVEIGDVSVSIKQIANVPGAGRLVSSEDSVLWTRGGEAKVVSGD